MMDRRHMFGSDPPPIKVVFADLDSLLEELRQVGVRYARLDLFRTARSSELSFVHHVTWMVCVTAWDPGTATVYEYEEPAATTITADPPEAAPEPLGPRQRMEAVRNQMQAQGLDVRRGRFVLEAE
ncbi:hypothetical protein [Alicyclobacillus sp.]|uniref:hypothetical protein n=1 Tax=Alicyclobacillus sp. TaxID=61169 RepID=UPI0025B93A6A|nr:hypothetical protein [Alicyclobacillus sp.]MCL6515840.1 hypothetical protein [Alicyclobacillus sp.]